MNADDLRQLAEARAWLPAPAERKRIRVAAGVSVRALADAVCVTASALNSLERAERPNERHLVRYTAILRGLQERPVREALTETEAKELLERWEKDACGSCGGLHATAVKAPGSCPRIKRICYDAQGRMLEVEYWPDGKWPKDGIAWPDDFVGEPES